MIFFKLNSFDLSWFIKENYFSKDSNFLWNNIKYFDQILYYPTFYKGFRITLTGF